MNINDEEYDWVPFTEEDEEEKVLSLTRDEVLYIDDQLTMMIERDGRSESFSTVRPVIANAGLPAPVELLDKVGMAVLQITEEDISNDTEVTLKVSPTDLYMLREIAKSSIKLNGKFVGLSLKKKIYKLLYENEYKAERNLEQLLADVDVELDKSKPMMDWSGE